MCLSAGLPKLAEILVRNLIGGCSIKTKRYYKKEQLRKIEISKQTISILGFMIGLNKGLCFITVRKLQMGDQ